MRSKTNPFITHKLIATCFFCIIILFACKQEEGISDDFQLKLTEPFPTLSFSAPVAMYMSQADQWFLVEQAGVIRTFSQQGENVRVFLDIRNRVRSGGERGLLGMALDPDFENNGFFYVSYTANNNESVLSLFSSKDHIADTSSEKILLTVPQPYSNHNGGQISFGPNKLLYYGLGDGGSGGDPEQNGQNINTLLGALLRIDVSKNDGTYDIPSTNPFINKNGKDEIFAYGLRNPWRWSFDKITGALWLADVGQNEWEEINIITSGGNYGWNIMEGKNCFSDNCINDDLIDPIFEYSHAEGYSITGGYVYRSNKMAQLYGYYIYADYVTKKIWGLKQDHTGTIINKLLLESNANISSFAEDNDGDLYILDHQKGKILTLTN